MATGRKVSTDTQPRFRHGVHVIGPAFLKQGIARNETTEFHEDFIGDAGDTIPAGLKATKTGASTNNTVDYVSGADGQFALTHSADSEAQTMRVDNGDSLWVNLSKTPIVAIRAKINFAGATFSADQRAVFGIGSAYNATLNDVATNAWFRVEGADLSIFIESDDGVTDDDDNDSGIDIVDDTFTLFEIDFTDLSAVTFFVDGVGAGELDMSGLSADTVVQPLVAIQRDAGAEQEVLTIDYIHAVQERS
jgi:hypothetical protein